MSQTYPEYPGTNFPDRIDSFVPMMDVSAQYKDLAARYYQYVNAGQYDAAADYLKLYPQLDQMSMNAEKMNRVYDTLRALERKYLEDIEHNIYSFWHVRGDYDPTAKYTKGDIVYYQEGDNIISFMANELDIPIGMDPTNRAFWGPLTLVGPKGDNGRDGLDGKDGKDGADGPEGPAGRDGKDGVGWNYIGAWDDELACRTGDAVTFDNCLWGATRNSTGMPPTEDSGYWNLILRGFTDPLYHIVGELNYGTELPEDDKQEGRIYCKLESAPEYMIANPVNYGTELPQTDLYEGRIFMLIEGMDRGWQITL